GGPVPWRPYITQHGHVRTDHVHASPEPDTQTESHLHRAIPASPLLLTKYEIRVSELDEPPKARAEPCLQTDLPPLNRSRSSVRVWTKEGRMPRIKYTV